MTAKRSALIVIRAALIAALMATLLTSGNLVRLEVWMGATTVIIAANLVVELIRASAVELASMSGAWTWSTAGSRRRNQKRPSELSAIEALLTSAQTNHRAHSNRLQPRLEQLANHFLPIHHAIDPGKTPAQASALLGDVAWLIDADASGRLPTSGELHQFLDIIMSKPMTETHK